LQLENQVQGRLDDGGLTTLSLRRIELADWRDRQSAHDR
jgi:hypothetical protein